MPFAPTSPEYELTDLCARKMLLAIRTAFGIKDADSDALDALIRDELGLPPESRRNPKWRNDDPADYAEYRKMVPGLVPAILNLPRFRPLPSPPALHP